MYIYVKLSKKEQNTKKKTARRAPLAITITSGPCCPRSMSLPGSPPFPLLVPMVTSRHNCSNLPAGAPFTGVAAATLSRAHGGRWAVPSLLSQT